MRSTRTTKEEYLYEPCDELSEGSAGVWLEYLADDEHVPRALVPADSLSTRLGQSSTHIVRTAY